jgi:hypothetical protein
MVLHKAPQRHNSLDLMQHTDFAEAKIQKLLFTSKLPSSDVDLLAVMAMAGVAGEAMTFDQVCTSACNAHCGPDHISTQLENVRVDVPTLLLLPSSSDLQTQHASHLTTQPCFVRVLQSQTKILCCAWVRSGDGSNR